jgi:hypothetical protein
LNGWKDYMLPGGHFDDDSRIAGEAAAVMRVMFGELILPKGEGGDNPLSINIFSLQRLHRVFLMPISYD